MSRSGMMTIAALMGGVFVLVGLGMMLGLTLRPMWRAHASQGWTEARCTIDRSEVESHLDSDGDRLYGARVEYTYDAGGGLLRGDRIAFTSASSTSSESWAADTAARYPVGAQVPCWYDPAEPSAVVLSRTIGHDFLLAIGVPFALIGFFMLRYGRSRGRDDRAAASTSSGRHFHIRRGSGALELGAALALWALTVATAVLARSVAVSLVSTIALVVAVAVTLIAAHELRCWLSVVTLTAPERIRRGEELRPTWAVRSLLGSPYATARLIAVETVTSTATLSASVETSTIRTLAIGELARAVRVPDDAPITVADGRRRLDWFVEVRAHLLFGPDVTVRAPITVEA